MNISRRPWPRGETYAGFFRSKTHGPVRIELRNSRDVYPPLQAAPFNAPSDVLLKTLAELDQLQRDMDSISGIPAHLMGGPSAQHKAECDCAEWYGAKCQWPDCEGGNNSMRRELVPPGRPAIFGLFDIASGRAIRDRLTRKRST